MAGLVKGIMQRVENLDPAFGAHPEYVAVKVETEGLAREETLLFTDSEIEGARQRAERCPATVEANRVGWVRDLLD